MTPKARIRKFREALGLSTRELAAGIGVSQAVVSSWETGKTEFRLPNALALQFIYGVRWQWLMTGEGGMWVGSTNDTPTDQPSNGVDVPVFQSIPAMEADGTPIPAEGCERFTFSAPALRSYIQHIGGGTLGTFFFLWAPHGGFGIQKEDLVLINSAVALRRSPGNGNAQLHLARPSLNDYAAIRRLFVTPTPSVLNLVGPDGSAQTLAPGKTPLEQLVLGRVCTWIHQEVR